MEIGIFAKTFKNNTAEDIFEKIASYGFNNTHLSLTTVGVEAPFEEVEQKYIENLMVLSKQTNVKIASLSGTYNMIDPVLCVREAGKKQLIATIKAANKIGVPFVTLCTGTNNMDSMWVYDKENESKKSWDTLTHELGEILPYAEKYGVTLLMEPEQSNVISSAAKCRKIMDEMKSENLKVIMDAANLFTPETYSKMQDVLDEAFDLLSGDIKIVHAKDIAKSQTLSFVAAGDGILDYRHYFSLLKKYAYDGAMQLHGLSEEQIKKSVAYIQAIWNEIK